jgi:hypothetical protein
MTKSLHFGHSTVIYHRDRLMEVGAFDIAQKRRHDIDLWLRMIHDHTWTYAAGPAAAYRYETPGSISRNTVEVAYYALRALHKNLPLFSDNRQYAALVEQHAKRGMSVAFNDADSDIETKLRKLAWPLLTGGYKAFYAGARACPPVFKALVRIKRNTYNVLRRRARHAREQAELNQFT